MKNKRNLNTKWLLLQNDQNADTTLLHSHDDIGLSRNCMTDHAQKNITQFLISQSVAILSWLVMLVVGLIDTEHKQSGIFLSFFSFQKLLLF